MMEHNAPGDQCDVPDDIRYVACRNVLEGIKPPAAIICRKDYTTGKTLRLVMIMCAGDHVGEDRPEHDASDQPSLVCPGCIHEKFPTELPVAGPEGWLFDHFYRLLDDGKWVMLSYPCPECE